MHKKIHNNKVRMQMKRRKRFNLFLRVVRLKKVLNQIRPFNLIMKKKLLTFLLLNKFNPKRKVHKILRRKILNLHKIIKMLQICNLLI